LEPIKFAAIAVRADFNAYNYMVMAAMARPAAFFWHTSSAPPKDGGARLRSWIDEWKRAPATEDV